MYAIKTEDFGENGVESPHPEVFAITSHHFFDTLTHLASGFIGKSQEKNLEWVDALFDEIRRSVSKHSSFARTRPRNNHQWSVNMLYRFLLRLIESL